MLTLFNTLTRKKEEFKPLHDNEVGLYTCGPTVYNYAHIGNLRTYIFEDILKRTLVMDGYKVKHVMNITDVGHLTSDADEGEDKMEKSEANMLYFICEKCKKEAPSYIAASKNAFKTLKVTDCKVVCKNCGHKNNIYKQGDNTNLFLKENVKETGKQITVWEIAQHYTDAFQQNLRDLNIIEPDVWCKATDHIAEQLDWIKKLEEKGFTYRTSDGIYFDTSKFKDYGQLTGQKLDQLKEGARVEKNPEKKNPTDFALWKFSPRDKKRQMEWDSPWGKGFPGWHIECSVMSQKYLGETLDIHCGGVDHIAIHHTNEIAQAEAVTDKPFVRYWLHGEFLNIEGGDKMAKSAGNFTTLQTLKDKKINPLAFRYLILGTHYRKKLNFTWQALSAAQNTLDNLYTLTAELGEPKTDCAEFEQRFMAAMNDDLNTPQALAVVWDMFRSNNPLAAKKASLLKFDKILGLNLAQAKPIIVPEEVKKLSQERESLRQQKKWDEADRIRQEITKQGFQVDDTPAGSVVKKLK